MADETTVEKHYCYPCASSDNSINPMLGALLSKDSNNPAMMAMMQNNQMNNPMWLVWMFAMRWMYGNGDGYGNNAQLAQLQGQVADNQSFNNMLSAITQNQNVINDIATRTSTSIDFVRESLASLGSAIQNVAGKTELSAERVINAANLGDLNIVQQLKDCCCNTQKSILTQGYEAQLANERQTNQLGSQISNFQSANQLGQFQIQSALGNQINDARNAMVNGFANIGYTTAQQTCDLKTNQNENTQRIIDTLNNHWVAEQSQELQNAKFEISQMKQNQVLLNAINGGCQCNS